MGNQGISLTIHFFLKYKTTSTATTQFGINLHNNVANFIPSNPIPQVVANTIDNGMLNNAPVTPEII